MSDARDVQVPQRNDDDGVLLACDGGPDVDADHVFL